MFVMSDVLTLRMYQMPPSDLPMHFISGSVRSAAS